MALRTRSISTLLLLTALVSSALALSHVRVRIHRAASPTASNATTSAPVPINSSSSSSSGSLFGFVEKVADPAQFRIAACAPQSWNVTRANASAVWLDFGAIDALGDQIVVSALDGSHPQVFDVALAGISTAPIVGNGVTIAFRPSTTTNRSSTSGSAGCAATGRMPSFRLEGIGSALSRPVRKESVCSAQEKLLNTKCLTTALGARANAVLRLATAKEDGKTYFCTGWLWGRRGHVVTNFHCLSRQAHADQTKFQFKVEMPSCRDKPCAPLQCAVGETLDGRGAVELVKADAALDIAVLRITKDADRVVRQYGYLQLRDGDAEEREPFLLVQHPNGGPKVLPGILKASTASIPVLSHVYRAGAGGAVTALGYMADTEGGSSGSPLIAYADKLVIGVHHQGGCPNRAVASGLLVNFLRALASDNDGIVKA